MQTVQTQIRLLFKEQSDEGLHCLPFLRHFSDPFLYGKSTDFKFLDHCSIYAPIIVLPHGVRAARLLGELENFVS